MDDVQPGKLGRRGLFRHTGDRWNECGCCQGRILVRGAFAIYLASELISTAQVLCSFLSARIVDGLLRGSLK
jgi:hypothetical protein